MIGMVRLMLPRWGGGRVPLALLLVWGLPWTSARPVAIDDQVTMPSLPGSADAVVIARGGTQNGMCVYNLLRKGRGALQIGQLVPASGCKSDLLLFSQDGAMSTTPAGWTSGNDVRALPALTDRVKVELSFVMVAKGPKADQQVASDLTQANVLYQLNRTGLAFQVSRTVTARSLTTAEVAIIGQDCSTERLTTLAQRAKLYDATRVNVYFVPGMVGWRGRTCFVAGFTNVIFISIAGESPGTLAHELGHALGLQDWGTLRLGHTGAYTTVRIPGFVYQNLMWTGLYDQEAREQYHLSIGQGYRMNMDTRSWVIKAGVVPGRAGLACHPTKAQDSIPCPSLAVDTVPT